MNQAFCPPNFRVRAIGAVLLALFVPPAIGAIRFVNAKAAGTANGTSWANAFPEVRPALLAATSGDEVWVAAGTYFPDYNTQTKTHDGNRDLRFTLKAGVRVFGGSKNSAPCPVPHVVSACVCILQPLHSSRKVRLRRFDQQVVMIAHQHPGMDAPARPPTCLTQCLKKELPILVIM